MLVHPEIDPVAFAMGPLAVRWYGLMYLAGFAAGWWLGRRRISRGLAPIARQQLENLIFAIAPGVIVGGRLGYVLFYKPAQYAANPLEIRFIAEFARGPDAYLGLPALGLSMGQWLSLPMIPIGAWLFFRPPGRGRNAGRFRKEIST